MEMSGGSASVGGLVLQEGHESADVPCVVAIPTDARTAPSARPGSRLRRSSMLGVLPSAKTRSISRTVSPRAVSLAPGLQKQPVRTEMRRSAADASTFQKSTMPPAGSSRLKATVPPRSTVVGRTVQPNQRCPVGMTQHRHALQEQASHRLDMPVDRRHAHRREMTEPDLDGGKPEIVDRAVLETDLVVGERVTLHDDRRHRDGPAREPRPSQAGERLAAHDERSDPRRVPEQLVPGDGDEIRVPSRQVEAVRRRER